MCLKSEDAVVLKQRAIKICVSESTVPRTFVGNIRQKHKIQGILILKQDHHEEQVLGYWDSA
jgi:hypothetical protein